MALDLDKLEKALEESLEKETPESLNEKLAMTRQEDLKHFCLDQIRGNMEEVRRLRPQDNHYRGSSFAYLSIIREFCPQESCAAINWLRYFIEAEKPKKAIKLIERMQKGEV